MSKNNRSIYTDSVPMIVRGMLSMGIKESVIRNILKVSSATFLNWQKAHPELKEAIEEGKELSTATIVAAHIRSAIGYTIETKKIEKDSSGTIIKEITEQKYIKPSVPAQINILANRDRENWGDRPDLPKAGALKIEVHVPPEKSRENTEETKD